MFYDARHDGKVRLFRLQFLLSEFDTGKNSFGIDVAEEIQVG